MKISGAMFHQMNHEITRIQDKNGLLVFCNTDGQNYVKHKKQTQICLLQYTPLMYKMERICLKIKKDKFYAQNSYSDYKESLRMTPFTTVFFFTFVTIG